MIPHISMRTASAYLLLHPGNFSGLNLTDNILFKEKGLPSMTTTPISMKRLPLRLLRSLPYQQYRAGPTMRSGSTAQILAKCVLEYDRIFQWHLPS